MSQEYIEVTEKTLDDAITTACQKLSVTSDRLDYTVIQEGKGGFLGFNAKPWIIRAGVKESSQVTNAVLNEVLQKAEEKVKAVEKNAEAPAPKKEKVEKKQEKKENTAKKVQKEEPKSQPAKEEAPSENKSEKKDQPREKRSRRHAEKKLTPEQIQEMKNRADVFLKDVFKAMDLEVEIATAVR